MSMYTLLSILLLGGSTAVISPAAEPQDQFLESSVLESLSRAQGGSASTLTPLALPPRALLEAKMVAPRMSTLDAALFGSTGTKAWTLTVHFDTNGDGTNDASQTYGIVKETFEEVSARQVGPYGEGTGLFGSDEGNVGYDPSQDPIADFMPYNYGTLIETGTPTYWSPSQTPAYKLARPFGAEIDVYFSDNGHSTYVPVYGIPLDVSPNEAPAYHRPILVTITRRWDEWTVAHERNGQYYALTTVGVPVETGVRLDTTAQFENLLSNRGVNLDAAMNAIDTTSSFLGAVAELSFDDYQKYSKTDGAGSILALAEFLGGLTGLLNSEQQLITSALGYAVDLYEILFEGSATGFVGGLVMSAFIGRLMQASADMQAYQRARHITCSNYFGASLQRAVYLGIDSLTAQRPFARIYTVDSNTWPLFPTFGSVIDDLYWGLYGPDLGNIQRHGLWGTIENNNWYFIYSHTPASTLFGAGAALGALALKADQTPDVNGNGADAVDLFANAFNTAHRATQHFSEPYFGSVIPGNQLICTEIYNNRCITAYAINPATIYQTVMPASDGAAMVLVSYLSVLNKRFSYNLDTSMPGYARENNARSTLTVPDDNMIAAMGVLGRIHGFLGYWGAFAYTDTDVDFASTDADGDGIPTGQEELNGTDAYNPDTDYDGLDDGDEAPLGCLATDADSNSDTVLDGDEDYDGDGLTNHEELYIYRSNPTTTDLDLDLDGLSNSTEKSSGLDPGNRDSDGDGVIDGQEVNQLGSNPLVTDTDGDGLSDGKEASLFAATLGQDYDSDGKTDGPLDSDSDGDGRSDRTEYDAGTNLLGANYAPNIAMEAPESGATLSGTTSIKARVSDEDGFANISMVRFYRSGNGTSWSELSNPISGADGLWSRSFDTQLVQNGMHYFKASAWDQEQATDMSSVQITIANPNRKPACSVTTPNGGESIPCSSTQTTAKASDPDVGDAVIRVEFDYSKDSTNWYNIGTDSDGSNGWSLTWATSNLPGGGGYKIRARSFDGELYSDWDTSDSTFTVTCPYCGDGACNDNESCSSCPQDCGVCPYCGDRVCNGGENCKTCPLDCGTCPYCGDRVCNGSESCKTCRQDCPACSSGSCKDRCPGTSWNNKCKCPDGFTGFRRCTCDSSCRYSCSPVCLCPF